MVEVTSNITEKLVMTNDDRFLTWYKMFGVCILGILDPQDRPNKEHRMANMYYVRRLYEFYF